MIISKNFYATSSQFAEQKVEIQTIWTTETSLNPLKLFPFRCTMTIFSFLNEKLTEFTKLHMNLENFKLSENFNLYEIWTNFFHEIITYHIIKWDGRKQGIVLGISIRLEIRT